MASALTYLALAAVLATAFSALAWLRQRKPRSPLKSIDDFQDTLKALSPRDTRRRRSA